MNAGDRVAEYVLLEKLGEGGFGEVWKGENPELPGRFVAIKVPTDAAYVAALRREARIECSLDHPNIVRTITLNTSAQPPYFVMEYVPGESLRVRLDREGKLAPAEAVRVLCGVLMALDAAHAAGVVHRDVKPGNILLGPDGAVKVTDFGLGTIDKRLMGSVQFSAGRSASADRAIAGTLHYMAPEQFRGEMGDARADLYACGILLYEMLTGHAHPIRLPVGGAPSDLGSVVEQAISEDPGCRFASARQMEQEARRALSSGAPPVPMTPRPLPPVMKATPPPVRCPVCKLVTPGRDPCPQCGAGRRIRPVSTLLFWLLAMVVFVDPLLWSWGGIAALRQSRPPGWVKDILKAEAAALEKGLHAPDRYCGLAYISLWHGLFLSAWGLQRWRLRRPASILQGAVLARLLCDAFPGWIIWSVPNVACHEAVPAIFIGATFAVVWGILLGLQQRGWRRRVGGRDREVRTPAPPPRTIFGKVLGCVSILSLCGAGIGVYLGFVREPEYSVSFSILTGDRNKQGDRYIESMRVWVKNDTPGRPREPMLVLTLDGKDIWRTEHIPSLNWGEGVLHDYRGCGTVWRGTHTLQLQVRTRDGVILGKDTQACETEHHETPRNGH